MSRTYKIEVKFTPETYEYTEKVTRDASLRKRGKYVQTQIIMPTDWIGRNVLFVRHDGGEYPPLRGSPYVCVGREFSVVREVKLYKTSPKYRAATAFLPGTWGDCKVDCYLLPEDSVESEPAEVEEYTSSTLPPIFVSRSVRCL